jgi:hypothetical protein
MTFLWSNTARVEDAADAIELWFNPVSSWRGTGPFATPPNDRGFSSAPARLRAGAQSAG